jgi:hypothetical protein
MKRRVLELMSFLFLAAACGPSQPLPGQPRPIVVPGASSARAEVKPAPPPLDPGAVSVTAMRRPPQFLLDGDVREWGSLLPPLPHPDEPQVPMLDSGLVGSFNPVEHVALDPGDNPRDAASHVGIALTRDALLIAAELGALAKDGIWLGIGSLAPDLPPVGEAARGGYTRPFNCEYEQVDIGEGRVENGKRNPPEVEAACKALIARHAQRTAEYNARFTRLFKVDREGARFAQEDGRLSAIEGAKALWKQGVKGATIEISLPLAALPRLSQAPLDWLRLAAAIPTSPRPAIVDAAWVWVHLPEPVSFEPHGEIRARAFHALHDRTFFSPALSYTAADPLHVETMQYNGYDRTTVEPRVVTLYEKRATMGDVEVGEVWAYGRSIAILKQGKVTGFLPAMPELNAETATMERAKGYATRDGELHVLSYAPGGWTDLYASLPAQWSVIAVAPDGSHRMDTVDDDVGVGQWTEVTEFASKDFETFGLRGATHYPVNFIDFVEVPVGVEITWRWDTKLKKYMGKQRRIAVPKKTKTR